MATFRILHLSDLHIGAHENEANIYNYWKAGAFPSLQRVAIARMSSHDRPALEAAVRLSFKRRTAFDVAIFTGDIATSGERSDLQRAHDHFSVVRNPAAWVTPAGHPSFDHLRGKLRLLPGNHDRYQTLASSILSARPFGAGAMAFNATFARLWSGGNAELSVLEKPQAGESLAIVSADLTLRSTGDARGGGTLTAERRPGWSLSYLGRGCVYRDVIQSMENATTVARQTGKPPAVIWAIHFAPGFDAHNEDADLDLIGDMDLLDAAQRLNVSHILCGHTHIAHRFTSPTHPGVTICCAGTVSQFGARAHEWHEYDLDIVNGRIVSLAHRTRTYRREGIFQHRFV